MLYLIHTKNMAADASKMLTDSVDSFVKMNLLISGKYQERIGTMW